MHKNFKACGEANKKRALAFNKNMLLRCRCCWIYRIHNKVAR